MNTKEALIKAKNLLNQGWCQAKFRDSESNKYCTMGAIFAVCPDQNGQNEMVEAFGSLLPENPSNGLKGTYAIMANIMRWNDAPERTKKEVIEVLNKAIEAC